jgi:hypothetical protein
MSATAAAPRQIRWKKYIALSFWVHQRHFVTRTRVIEQTDNSDIFFWELKKYEKKYIKK